MVVSRTQLSPDHWTHAALSALVEGGISAVRIDALARTLGVTRGSFYWHFKDRDAVLSAALERWERTLTAQVIEQTEIFEDPAERFERLFRVALASEPVQGLQPAIMAHADHPLVAPVLRRVTTRRIDYIAALYQQLGLAPAAARERAVIAYATYLGWLDLRRLSGDEVTETHPGREGVAAVDELIRLLLTGLPGGPR